MKTSPTTKPLSAYSKGVMGENAACLHLEEKGMTLLDRRWRSPCGEIDLVMLEGETLVFIEVKAREHITRHQAQFAVTPVKQRRLVQTALYYLNAHPEHEGRLQGFDVVTVAKDGILHLPNAFEASQW